jgi:multiple sugar transport system substrate-binding protein
MQNPQFNRRHFLRLTGLVSAGVVVAACAPATMPAPGADSGAAAPAAETAQLVFWAPQHFIVEQNEFFTESLKLAAEANAFEVEVQLFPWGDYNQKQNAAIEANTLPDALLGVSVSQQYAMGILSDVSDLFAEIGESGGGFYEPDIAEVTIEGKQVAIPFHNEPQFMYYRQDILEPAGFTAPLTSLDEFVEAAQAVTDPGARIWGFGNTYGLVPDGNNFTQLLIFAFGGFLQDADGNIAINSPETVEALNFSSRLLNEYEIMPSGVTGWDDTGNNKAFLSGQLAMTYNSGSILNNMRETDPGWLQSTVIGTLPGAPGGAPKTFVGGSAAGIMVSSPHPDLARLLIKNTMSPERYPGNLTSANGMFYPTLQGYEDLPIYTEDPWNKQALATLPYAYVAFAPGDPAAWIDEVNGKFLYAEMASRIAVEGWDTQEAIDDFVRQAEEIKAKYAAA